MHPSNKPTLDNADVLAHGVYPAHLAMPKGLGLAAEAFIRTILTHCPDCADRASAIRHVRVAKMFATASVALDPKEPKAMDV